MPHRITNNLLEIIKLVFKNDGLAGLIIIVFLSLFVFNTILNYKLLEKLENIVILNEYRITLLEEKEPP